MLRTAVFSDADISRRIEIVKHNSEVLSKELDNLGKAPSLWGYFFNTKRTKEYQRKLRIVDARATLVHNIINEVKRELARERVIQCFE